MKLTKHICCAFIFVTISIFCSSYAKDSGSKSSINKKNCRLQCRHGGECLGSSCQCVKPWSGKLCEKKETGCESEPCQNGGTCYNLPHNGAHYRCKCPQPFAGYKCEKLLPVKLPSISPSAKKDTSTSTEDVSNRSKPSQGPAGTIEKAAKIPLPPPPPIEKAAKIPLPPPPPVEKTADMPLQPPPPAEKTADMPLQPPPSVENLAEVPPPSPAAVLVGEVGCVTDPCQNDGECKDLPDGRYHCTCVRRYTGQHCETQVEDLMKSDLMIGIGASVTVILVLLNTFCLCVAKERKQLKKKYQSAIELGVKKDLPDIGWFAVSLRVMAQGCKSISTLCQKKKAYQEIKDYMQVEYTDDPRREESEISLFEQPPIRQDIEKDGHTGSKTNARRKSAPNFVPNSRRPSAVNGIYDRRVSVPAGMLNPAGMSRFSKSFSKEIKSPRRNTLSTPGGNCQISGSGYMLPVTHSPRRKSGPR